jgi:excisionase family DNA binding protein
VSTSSPEATSPCFEDVLEQLERLLKILRAAPTLRLALTPVEAAATVGCSRDFFDTHLLSELRVVRVGRKVLIPTRELERWLDEQAALTLDLRTSR